jgi:hypothetical protein
MKVLTGILTVLLILYFGLGIGLVATELANGTPWYIFVNRYGEKLVMGQERSPLSGEVRELPGFVRDTDTLFFPALSIVRSRGRGDVVTGAAILAALFLLFIFCCVLLTPRRPKTGPAGMIRCAVCGTELPGDANFCDRCGAKQGALR